MVRQIDRTGDELYSVLEGLDRRVGLRAALNGSTTNYLLGTRSTDYDCDDGNCDSCDNVCDCDSCDCDSSDIYVDARIACEGGLD
jgi:hypothetical protein